MELLVELPDAGVSATVRLFSEAAPHVTAAIYESLAEPLETRTSHACFDGHEVYCFLPPFASRPPLENRTMRPKRGEVMFFFADDNEFAFLTDDRLTGGSDIVHELAFMYGEVDLRHYWEEGMHGSLVGYVSEGFEPFAEACGRTLSEGSTKLRVSRKADT
jgi:hypothetical protein